MIERIKALFPYLVVSALTGLTIIEKSTSMAYAVALGMGFILSNNLIEKIKLAKEVKTGVPDEVRRNLQDLSARVTTIEHGIRVRGF